MFSIQLRSSLKKNKIKQSSYVIVMLFTNQVIFSSREFRPPEKLEMANLLSDEPTSNSFMPKGRLLQFDVQEFCDNFVEEVVKTLKDVNQTHKKSTSTRAPVAEPSLFISKKSKGKSETHVEELKDFLDSLPIYDEYDEEPYEILMISEKNYDFPSSESELMIDNEQAIVELTVLQSEHPSSLVLSPQVEEPLDYPHQGPHLDSRKPLYEDLGPIFDEEEDPGPVFDEETTSITSIAMEPTHQGFMEAWNRMKSFTEEGVMNFSNQRFSSPSIREYQTSKGDSCPGKKQLEPKPILGFKLDPSASQKDRNQEKWPWKYEVI
ncbi:hypothetical protein YC2023_049983 [Brassica napus]